MTLQSIKQELNSLANKEKAKVLQKFFKTQKGEYGEGDKFLGIAAPDQRKVAKKFKELPLNMIQKLLQSKIHEHRLTALLILTNKFQKADEKQKQKIFKFYLNNVRFINNWDLVDLSAPKIVGEYLFKKPDKRKILYRLAQSKTLWERRIAVLATFRFIKDYDFSDSLKISEILLSDKHDLIHKAVGWMLRETGKKDQNEEEKFLNKHYKSMPRTMLRYAIEKFSKTKRLKYLKK